MAIPSTLIILTWLVACGGSDATGTDTPPDSTQVPAATKLVGDDWTRFQSKTDLRNSNYFWWFDSRDVYDFVDLVQDPTFGQVVRITFPQNTGGPGSSPRLKKTLPSPQEGIWYRFRMKYSQGWSSAGPDPAGHANSYKIAFWTWEGYDGRGEVLLTNTFDYGTGVGVLGSSGYLNYSETALPNSAPNFGRITTEWTDGEWYEFVILYQKTGANSARHAYWRRRLTTAGRISPGAWVFHGLSIAGAVTPRVTSVELGANRNKNNPSTMYIYWGPWEVVAARGTENPFGVPYAQ